MNNNSHGSLIFDLTERFGGFSKVLIFGVIASLSSMAIASSVLAERREVDIRLQVNQAEGFTVMTRKAEALARSAAQRTFDSEVLVSDVSVKVTAQNQEQAAIILQLIVSRRNWVSRPDPKVWATYFPMTKTLMGLR
jgi:hypothetical protein